MVLTIVRKELRETRLFAALAVGLYVIYLCQLTGESGPPYSLTLSGGSPG